MIALTQQYADLKRFREHYQGSLLFVVSHRNESKVREVLNPEDEIILVEGEPRISDFTITPKGFLCDGVLGIGGGSVIDWAKYIYVLQNKITLTTSKNGTIQMNRKPRQNNLFVIPTLLGSGAEWSSSCPIIDGNRKVYLSHSHLVPKVLGVKNICLENYNRHPFKNQIADIFSHLFESLFSRRISEFDHRLILSYLETMKIKIQRKEQFDYPVLYSLNYQAGVAQDKFLVGPAHALAHTYYSHLGHAKSVALTMYIIYTQEKYAPILNSVGFNTDFFRISWLDYFEINTSNIINDIDWSEVNRDICMTFSKLR